MIRTAQIVGIILGVAFELTRYLMLLVYRAVVMKISGPLVAQVPLKNTPS